jgi:hypothetical protein
MINQVQKYEFCDVGTLYSWQADLFCGKVYYSDPIIIISVLWIIIPNCQKTLLQVFMSGEVGSCNNIHYNPKTCDFFLWGVPKNMCYVASHCRMTMNDKLGEMWKEGGGV